MTRINPKSVSNGLSFKAEPIVNARTHIVAISVNTTYDMNKNIVTVFEKGKDGSCGCCCGGTVTAEDVVKKCNEILASL